MNYLKLKGKIVEKELTYKDCAEFIGISTTSFNKKMNGSSRFYIEEVKLLVQLLNLKDVEIINIFF